ncbi:hypothetical protein J5N97_028072 [Dioscorea zingiberensis]|uniref:Uncharacterized protein n=1 Tax=Dioscorea zingiberensis TaxID=325984 RepID=A0A9D5BYG3_9LILI|nr:hypothetical protein J5N97_028072 [Dioscorea zingiberensis]
MVYECVRYIYRRCGTKRFHSEDRSKLPSRTSEQIAEKSERSVDGIAPVTESFGTSERRERQSREHLIPLFLRILIPSV